MYTTGIRKHLYGAAATLMLAIMIPSVASAVPTNAYTVTVNGNIDTSFNLSGGPTPFNVGDPVTGSFDLTVGADNAFDVGNTVNNPIGSLSNFYLTVGSVVFDLNTSDFTEVSGNLSADGLQVEQLFLDTYYLDVGLDRQLTLQVQGPPDLLYVGNAGITHAPITTTVSAQATAVPEPGSLAMLSFGLLLIGVGTYGARRRMS